MSDTQHALSSSVSVLVLSSGEPHRILLAVDLLSTPLYSFAVSSALLVVLLTPGLGEFSEVYSCTIFLVVLTYVDSTCALFASMGIGVGGNLPVDGALFLEFLPFASGNLLTMLSVWWPIGQLIGRYVWLWNSQLIYVYPCTYLTILQFACLGTHPHILVRRGRAMSQRE